MTIPRGLLLALVSASTGCGAQGASSQAATSPSLRSIHAEHARHGFDPIVRGAGRIEREGGAFVASFATPATARVRLPSRANEAFELANGAAKLTVTLLGAREVAGVVDEDAVVYRDALEGGTLFHVPTADGTEEYVRYDARPRARELRYRLSLEHVAGLRLVDGQTLELLDASGDPRLRTTAPWLIDAKGAMRRGALALEDCAHDTSAAAPWGRPVVAAGRTCTLRATWDDAGLSYPLLVDPPWTAAGSLATKRYAHAATSITGSAAPACASGCVLVTGGMTGVIGSGSAIGTAELYNAATGTWASAGSIAARFEHAQVDNTNGTATVFGGATEAVASPAATSTVSTYNPAGGWSFNAAMPSPRWGHAVYRYSGSTYVTGGFATGTTTAQASFYSYNGTTWQTLGDLAIARARHSVASLTTGKPPGMGCAGFVVVGGTSNGTNRLDSVQHYGFVGGSGCALSGWKPVGSLSVGRSEPAAVNQGGDVYVFGGTAGLTGGGQTIEVIDYVPPSGIATTGTFALTTWTDGASTRLSRARTGLTGTLATVTGRQRIVAIGGQPTTGTASVGTAEIIDTAAPSVAVISPLLHPRKQHTATALPDGRVLVVGGVSCSSATTCTHPPAEEIFNYAVPGSTCVSGAECASGFCADGVCCDTACGDQCEACNEPGSAGTCKPIAGAPRGTRPVCPSPSTGPCGYQCNGMNATACVAPTSECSMAVCTGNVLTPASKCDGAGTCVAQAPVTCGSCVSGKCDAIAAQCDATGARSVPLDGSAPRECAPFRCDVATGTCLGSCTSSTDCQPGAACTSGTCVAAAGDAGDDGGCAFGARTTRTSLVSLAVLAVIAGAFRRRRR